MGRLALSVLLVLGIALAAAPAAAHAASPWSVTMFSDSGDYIGHGQQQLFDESNASMSVSGSAGDVTISLSGGPSGTWYDLEFAAAPGQQLTGGVYTGAQRASFRSAGHPGIDINGDGRGCNTDSGSFEVKDIAFGSDGTLERLWLIYEQHCEGAVPALFGEVRIGEPPTDASANLEPSLVRWPSADLGRAGTTVPVTLTGAASTLGVSGASISGPAASDFTIREDDCTGFSISAGDGCQVWVRFIPTVAGTREAQLDITDTTGKTRSVPLQGFAYGGTTKFTMLSDPGDYIGGGVDNTYTPANAVIAVSGTRSGVSFSVNGDQGDWWSGDLVPASGDILTPGTYPDATRYPFNNGGVGLDVGGDGRGCNTLTGSFTVTTATWYSDGSLRTFGADYEQHCEGATPALRGTIDFRAGDNTPPAPWMAPGTTSGSPPPSSPAAEVQVSLSPSSITADGSSQSTVTAKVTDAGGQAVQGDAIAFSSDGGQSFGPVTDHGDGSYSAVLTSTTKAGSSTVTARDTSVSPAVSGSAQLRQTPVPATRIAPVPSTGGTKTSGPGVRVLGLLVSHHGTLTMRILAPGPGSIVINDAALPAAGSSSRGARARTIARGRFVVSARVRYVRLRLTRSGRAVVAELRRIGRPVRIEVSVTFRPASGQASRVSSVVRLARARMLGRWLAVPRSSHG